MAASTKRKPGRKRSDRPKVRLVVGVSPLAHDRLRFLAEESGRPMWAIVEEAIAYEWSKAHGDS